MPNLSWLARVVADVALFVAWCVHALDPLTNVSSAAHTWVVIFVLATFVEAVALVLFNTYPYIAHRPQA